MELEKEERGRGMGKQGRNLDPGPRMLSYFQACVLVEVFLFSTLGEQLRVLFSFCFQSSAIELDRPTERSACRSVEQKKDDE